jgi:hypothetical protein
MAAARFQILAVLSETQTAGFTWRFLSANNRRLGQSVEVFPDLDACWAAVRELRDRLDGLDMITLRDGLRQWVWRVRLGELDLAVSSRSYQRRVEAEHAGSSFVEQVGHVPAGRPPQVVRFG